MNRTRPLTILLIAHESKQNFELIESLAPSGFSKKLIKERSLSGAAPHLKEEPAVVDVILLDCSVIHAEGLYSFKNLLTGAGAVPVIILAFEEESNLALELVRLGAQDCLIKSHLSRETLIRSIRVSLERKRNESRMQEFNDKLVLVTQVSNEVIWDLDLMTNTVARDRERLKTVFGIEEEAGFDTWSKWLSRLHPEDQAHMKATVSEILAAPVREVYDLEYRIRPDNKTYIYVYDRLAWVKDKKGNVIRVVGAAQNNTVKKKAEEKFALIFNKNPVPTWVYDAESLRFLEVNEAAVHTYGYSREEFLGMTGRELRYEEARREFEADIATLLSTGSQQRRRWQHRKKDGDTLLADITAFLMDFFGTPAILVQAQDITEEERLKKTLEKREKQRQHEIMEAVISAEEKQRSRIGEELHDNVNQILASAKIYLETSLSIPQEKDLYIRRGISLIQTALEEIRKLSRDLVISVFQGHSLLESVEELTQTISWARNIDFNIQSDDFDESRLNEGHKLAIYRIVQEQVSNILKHSGASQVQITLAIHDAMATMVISDNGRGFNPQIKQEGIGLTNIASRASFFDGGVDIRSAPGEGCQLVVYFPLDQ